MCMTCGVFVPGPTVVVDGGRLCLDLAQTVAEIRLRELGQCGPYESADDAIDDFEYTAMDSGPGHRGNEVRLAAACSVAGIELDQFDRHTIAWLGERLDPATAQVLVGLISRAAPLGDDAAGDVDDAAADRDAADSEAQLAAACTMAGVELGEFDCFVIAWLAEQFEPAIPHILARLICSAAPQETTEL